MSSEHKANLDLADSAIRRAANSMAYYFQDARKDTAPYAGPERRRNERRKQEQRK